MEQQMDQPSQAMTVMLPMMMKTIGQMRTMMELEIDKSAH
jgi:hypothetical protein